MTASSQSPSCIRTRAASPATSSQGASPSSNSQSDNPFASARMAAADRSLLVRVLNRNLAHQREEANLQSLGSDPLLTSLPAGKASHTKSSVWLAAQAVTKCGSSQCWSQFQPWMGFQLCKCCNAGSPLSYPNTATARMVADHMWSPIESHLTGIDSPDDRSPITPAAAALLSDCYSPTSVLLQSTGTLTSCHFTSCSMDG